MKPNLHGERAFCVFVRFEGIYSACGFRLTHGLAPQQADAEPVHCFVAYYTINVMRSNKAAPYSYLLKISTWFLYDDAFRIKHLKEKAH